MPVRVLERETWIPAPVDEVFEFFSNARNLEEITPPFLKFKVVSPGPIEMRQGALIDYRLSLRGVPMRWRTEITDWQPGKSFTDSQIRGPYRRWVHTHSFESKDGGTAMRDRVEYVIPGGPLEGLFYPFVKRDVEAIFDFRERQIRERFKSSNLKEPVRPR